MSCLPRSLLVVGLIVMAAGPLSAAGVNWRTDYAAAVREAKAAGKPLFFDIGTEGCFYCKKLDMTTFRDSNIAALLNTKFVSVKVDADRSPQLAQGFGATAYPTLVIAGPDGKVIDTHTGYAEVPQMSGMLQQGLARVPKVETPVAAVIAPAANQPSAAPVPVDPWAAVRAEVSEGLGRSSLEKGAELRRQGRAAEATGWLELAASLTPNSAAGRAARELLSKSGQ